MTSIKQVRKTYKYRLFVSDDNRYLHQAINVAGLMWNYCIALQRRYYRLFGKYISQSKMQNRLKKRRNSRRYAFWTDLGSQAMQEVAERVHKGYTKFSKAKQGALNSSKLKSIRASPSNNRVGNLEMIATSAEQLKICDVVGMFGY